MGFYMVYPLVNKHNYGKSPFLMGKSTISMAIFNSYVIYQRVASYLCGFCRFANPAILRILVASIRQQQRFASTGGIKGRHGESLAEAAGPVSGHGFIWLVVWNHGFYFP